MLETSCISNPSLYSSTTNTKTPAFPFIGEFGHKPPDLDCELYDDSDNWALMYPCEYEEPSYHYDPIGSINEIISLVENYHGNIVAFPTYVNSNVDKALGL